MGVSRQRPCNATGECAFENEIESPKGWKLVALDVGQGERREVLGDVIGGELFLEQGKVRQSKGNDRDHRCVAFVAGAGMGQLIQGNFHDIAMLIVGETRLRGTRADSMARTGEAERVTPPPPAGPLV